MAVDFTSTREMSAEIVRLRLALIAIRETASRSQRTFSTIQSWSHNVDRIHQLASDALKGQTE